MCLETKSKRIYTVKGKPKTCYKVVRERASFMTSPYQQQMIRFNRIIQAVVNTDPSRPLKTIYFEEHPSHSKEWPHYIIQYGLHGFRSMKGAKRFVEYIEALYDINGYRSKFKIIKMVLPIRTKYCIGTFSDYKSIVATKAIYKEIK